MSVNSAAPVTTSWARGVRDSIDTFTIGNNAMYGRIDEVAFWKRILSPDERTRLYNSGNGTACGAVTALFTAKPIETVGGLND
jgi:hypothetical protein